MAFKKVFGATKDSSFYSLLPISGLSFSCFLILLERFFRTSLTFNGIEKISLSLQKIIFHRTKLPDSFLVLFCYSFIKFTIYTLRTFLKYNILNIILFLHCNHLCIHS